MNRIVSTWSTLLIALAYITLTGLPCARAVDLPSNVVPDFMGVQLKTDNFNVETINKVHDAGFRIFRRGFYWNAIETEKGVYDFSAYDQQMAEAKKLGMGVIGVLFGGNKLYEDDGQGGIQTDAGRKGFAAFAAALAEHYKDQTVWWEIWNEPNVRTFWRKNGTHNSKEFADEYSALVNETVPAMVKAAPGCFVMAGSVSNYWEPSYQWTEYCFQNGVLKSGIRGWSVHPYGVKTPEEFAIGHQRERELLQKYGAPDMPLLDTERGFSMAERAEGWSGGSKDRAAEFQADNLVRQFMIDQFCGVKLTSWYEWGGNEGFALTTSTGTSPAFTAATTMMTQLNGYHFVRRIDSDSPLDYVLLFENASGGRQLVAWTAPSAGGAPDEAKDHVAVITSKQSFTSVDTRGQSQTSHAGIPLMLSAAPQYVTLAADVELGKVIAYQPVTPAQPQAAAAPAAGTTDLHLFDPGTAWTFVKNTGQGSIELTKDGDQSIGVVTYDFSHSASKNTPYVLTFAKTNIPQAEAVVMLARSPIAQPLTFRLVDSTGQTLQFKTRIKGTGQWETIRIPLTRRLEHWGGANDAMAHFPIASIALSVPQPNPDHKTGKVEYAGIGYITQ